MSDEIESTGKARFWELIGWGLLWLLLGTGLYLSNLREPFFQITIQK